MWAAAAAVLAGLFFVGPHFVALHWTGLAGDAGLEGAANTLFPAVMLLGGVALLVAWIHPWQGEQIAPACAGAPAVRWRNRELGLLAPIAAVAVPLGYFAALSRFMDVAAWAPRRSAAGCLAARLRRGVRRHTQGAREPGGVLARTYAGSLVPGLTGRQTWVGHGSWTPAFGERGYLMRGDAEAAKAQAFVRATGARFVFADKRGAALRPQQLS